MLTGSTDAGGAPNGAAAPVAGSLLAQMATSAPAPAAAPAAIAPVEPAAPAKAIEVPAGRFKAHEDYASLPSMKKFLAEDGTFDPNVVVKSYLNVERMLGADKVVLPKDETDTDGWNALYAKLGRPETPDGYEIKRPEKMPEGIAVDENGEKFLRTLAHQNGLTPKQTQAMYDAFLTHQQQSMAAVMAANKAAIEEGNRALQREYGAGLAEVGTVVSAAFKQYGDAAVLQKIEAAGLANDPDFIRMFAKMGKDLVGETKLKGAGGEPIKTTKQWEQEAAEFRTKNQHALFSSDHPDHRRLVDELQKMVERAYPDERAA